MFFFQRTVWKNNLKRAVIGTLVLYFDFLEQNTKRHVTIKSFRHFAYFLKIYIELQ